MDRELREAGFGDEDAVQDMVMATRMLEAMLDVIADPGVTSVGEFPATVVTSAEGFRYSPFASVVAGFKESNPEAVEPRLGGTAAGGGFAYSVCVPRDPGVGAIGVYFLQGGLGALFHPVVSDAPLRYPGEDEASFLAAVERDYGFRLHGGILG